MEMLAFILAHWTDVFAIYGGVVALCTSIVKITPSTKDDSILDKVIKVVDLFSTAFTAKDAAKLEEKK
jgi:hypothetical protein